MRSFLSLSALAVFCASIAFAQTASRNPNPLHVTIAPSPYAIGELFLGEKVSRGDAARLGYDCAGSKKFDDFSWCTKGATESEPRGRFKASYSMMLDRDGRIVYLNRYQEPAYWGASEAKDDIQRYSKKVGGEARIIHLPAHPGLQGTLATWGNVELERISGDELNLLAADKPLPRGIAIDYIGNFTKSAQQGLPVYRLAGGAGFVWAGSYNDQGRGTLRFAAVNPSAYTPQAPPPVIEVRPKPSTQRNRIALLIGNRNYRYAGVLSNPANDAQLLAGTLRDVGFKSVTTKTDLTREQTMQALQEFARAADSAEWAVVYYSGHGIEFNGENYIIPVDAQLKTDRDIALETVDVDNVLKSIQGARRLRLVILDACRDNPFASQMKRTTATRSIGIGLARMEPEPGTLIAYAAKHGEFALDGTGSNSPFVEALTQRIRERPAQEIRRLFDLVRDDVMESTRRQQQPFTYGSLSGREDFYFVR
jgi:Caspase domain